MHYWWGSTSGNHIQTTELYFIHVASRDLKFYNKQFNQSLLLILFCCFCWVNNIFYIFQCLRFLLSKLKRFNKLDVWSLNNTQIYVRSKKINNFKVSILCKVNKINWRELTFVQSVFSRIYVTKCFSCSYFAVNLVKNCQ